MPNAAVKQHYGYGNAAALTPADLPAIAVLADAVHMQLAQKGATHFLLPFPQDKRLAIMQSDGLVSGIRATDGSIVAQLIYSLKKDQAAFEAWHMLSCQTPLHMSASNTVCLSNGMVHPDHQQGDLFTELVEFGVDHFIMLGVADFYAVIHPNNMGCIRALMNMGYYLSNIGTCRMTGSTKVVMQRALEDEMIDLAADSVVIDTLDTQDMAFHQAVADAVAAGKVGYAYTRTPNGGYRLRMRCKQINTATVRRFA